MAATGHQWPPFITTGSERLVPGHGSHDTFDVPWVRSAVVPMAKACGFAEFHISFGGCSVFTIALSIYFFQQQQQIAIGYPPLV
jgi:hypothetical protein